MLSAAMASDRNPDASKGEKRDESLAQELNSAPSDTAASHGSDHRSAEESGADDEPSERPVRNKTRTRSRRIADDDYDDDDYDDEDEDEDEEEERRRRERRARAARRAARARRAKAKLNIPTTEEQLNVPKFQTIGLLGSVSLLMIIIWFAARLACNAHPDHLRDPRYVSVHQLAVDPKNAALEFQLRFVSKDVLLAGELVTGKMTDTLRELIRACEGNMEPCEKDRDALKNQVTGSAKLLELAPKRAVVEVTTYIRNENPSTSVLELEPVGQIWKVSQSRPSSKTQPSAEPMTPPIEPAEPPP